MSRQPHQTEDRVIVSPAPDQFRVIGVAAHNWSNVLIENGELRCFVASTSTGQLSEILPEDAQRLIVERTFRPWNGSQAWTPLTQLPLIAPAFARPNSQEAAGSPY